MARNFTVAALTTRAQQRCDMENDSSISTAEWQGLLSSAYGELYSIIVNSGWRYFETTTSLTAQTTALPSGFWRALSVDYVVNATTGERRALRMLMDQERNLYRGMSSAESRAWALEGSNVVLYPAPISGQSYVFRYIPQPTDLTGASTSDTVDVVTPDGENFVVWAVACMAWAKDDDDRSRTVAFPERERARQRVMEDVAERAFLDPFRPICDDDSNWLPGDYF